MLRSCKQSGRKDYQWLRDDYPPDFYTVLPENYSRTGCDCDKTPAVMRQNRGANMDVMRLLGLNWDQLTSLSRSALKLLGMYLVMRGVTDEGTWETVSGAVLTIGGLVASHYAHG